METAEQQNKRLKNTDWWAALRENRKPIYRLKNWIRKIAGDHEYYEGNVEGHPEWYDGYPIATSIVLANTEDGIETINSMYILVGEGVKEEVDTGIGAKEFREANNIADDAWKTKKKVL